MASSGGRDKLRSRGPRVFAFGSSTPRDLSHMNKIPQKLRNYDAKNDTNDGNKQVDGPTLHDYIVKARSLSREAGSDSRSQFVFGSSTPRTLAHLDKIPQKQRVYDAKIPKKSATHSDFKAAPIRFNAPIVIQKPPKTAGDGEKRHVITSKDDDIASEPDIVQDREEFMNEMRRQHKKVTDEKKAKNEEEEVKTPTAVVPKSAESRQENVKYGHAPEIAGNAQKAVRIQSEMQEEAPIAVENLSANKMNDQIEVSQLLNEITPESVPAMESLDNTPKPINVVGDLLAKVQKVVNETTDKTVENVEKVIEDSTKKLEKEAEKFEKKIIETKKETSEAVVEKLEKLAEKVEDTAIEVKNIVEKAESKVMEAVKIGEEKAENVVDEVKNGLNSMELRRF